MKIRLGFVSNSSSSSYTALTTVENHEKALASLDDLDRGIMELLSKAFKKEKVFGLDLISFNLTTGEYSDFEWILGKSLLEEFIKKHPEMEEDEWTYIYAAVGRYEKAIEKDKENTWTKTSSF